MGDVREQGYSQPHIRPMAVVKITYMINNFDIALLKRWLLQQQKLKSVLCLYNYHILAGNRTTRRLRRR